MELNANYDIDYLADFIGQSALTQEKSVIFLRSTGWNSSSNVDAINASVAKYRLVLPLDILTALQQSEFTFIMNDNVEEALEFCEDAFPSSQSIVTTPEDYIFYAVYGPNGQILADNE